MNSAEPENHDQKQDKICKQYDRTNNYTGDNKKRKHTVCCVNKKYEVENFSGCLDENITFKSVKELKEQYLKLVNKKSDECKQNKTARNLCLELPSSGGVSSPSSGISDDEPETSGKNEANTVTRYGSFDSAMGHSEEEEKKDSPDDADVFTLTSFGPYNPRHLPSSSYSANKTIFARPRTSREATTFSFSPCGSTEIKDSPTDQNIPSDFLLEPSKDSVVPSRTILESQCLVYSVDRKLSLNEFREVDSGSGSADVFRRRRSLTFATEEDAACEVNVWRTPSVIVSDYSDEVKGGRPLLARKANLSTNSSESSLQNSWNSLSDFDYLCEPQRKLSSSTCSSLSGDEDDFLESKSEESSQWRKLRNIWWTPFFQTYKKQRYPWVQLAGHQGNFRAGPDQCTILKKRCSNEESCFKSLMNDELRPFVPEYKGIVGMEGEYIQLEDLLGDFDSPCVMDCKIGVRTYLEEELSKAKDKPKLRKDMYDKMCQIDEDAPTQEEHKLKGVTKPRYMVWRETISSTATLGFRIEGIRNASGTTCKDFKTTKTKDQILVAFQQFTKGFPHVVPTYIQRLKSIKETLMQSRFFETHELIGSSLLFVHDNYSANIWLIDFAKTVELPQGMRISHNTKWKLGNHEDGYLIGIDNLIKLFMSVLDSQPDLEVAPPPSILPDPPELMVEGMHHHQDK